jgi:FkbM family methyltransferase
MFISKSSVLSAAKNMLRSIGLEVSFADTAVTERNVLRPLFQSREFSFVLDVGANTGQYGLLVRSCGHLGPIVSFEPLAAAYEKLTACAASDPLWTVAQRTALGSRVSHATINVAGNSVSSSLLAMSARHLEAEPRSAFIGTEIIDVVALDDCFSRYVAATRGGFLKVDTQGYEMEVLRGAHRSLSESIDVVQIELSLVPLYEGQPLMLDICNLLKSYGFNLRHIIPGLKHPVSGALLQLDGIFARD